jgi:hypothetical protein
MILFLLLEVIQFTFLDLSSIYNTLLFLAGGCLGRALAIEFAREARCLALLDVQKKPLDDLKHALQQIYGKEHCRIYTYRCDLRLILIYFKRTNLFSLFFSLIL